MRVGFIGIGTMGVGISANIKKAGHDMIVHDARRQAAEKICAAGARWADTPKQVAAESEIVFTSLPGPPQFEAVVKGDNGLLAGMQKGQPLFDLSTNSPTVIRAVDELLPVPRQRMDCSGQSRSRRDYDLGISRRTSNRKIRSRTDRLFGERVAVNDAGDCQQQPTDSHDARLSRPIGVQEMMSWTTRPATSVRRKLRPA